MKLVATILSIVKPDESYKAIVVQTLRDNEKAMTTLRRACEKPRVMVNGTK